MFIVTKVKEITEASTSVGLLLATAMDFNAFPDLLTLHQDSRILPAC